MKKFLSLVLTLALAMSLVTVSAGATDFDDDGEITYQEAVTVIAGLGIVDGYSDGSFGPDEVLTRGAAAKIICNLILGPTTASALSASSAPFVDVPVSNTFAGYISGASFAPAAPSPLAGERREKKRPALFSAQKSAPAEYRQGRVKRGSRQARIS